MLTDFDFSSNDIMDFDLPAERSSTIKVVGVGGGGGNAVNHMFHRGIKGADFIICNTDRQSLINSPISVKVQIGEKTTEGLGAGSKPEIGRQAAEENIDNIMTAISSNTRMVFLSAGMGGGTGTGATPIIAKACKKAGFLTIGVVTIPFHSEGKVRDRYAQEGLMEMKKNVDALVVINNERLREIYGNVSISKAFAQADDVLATAVKGIAELITVRGYMNVDFSDVDTVMRNSGVACMGMGSASGEKRAIKAIEQAVNSPLLDSNNINGAKNILINVVTTTNEQEQLTLDEFGEIIDYLSKIASKDVQIIPGVTFDDSLGEKVSVTVVATGFNIEHEKSIIKLGEERSARKGKVVDLIPPTIISPRKEEDEKTKQTTHIVSDIDLNRQGVFDFDSQDEFIVKRHNNLSAINTEADEEQILLSKKKALFNTVQHEGLSAKTISDNIDYLEAEPAYKRATRNINLDIKPEQLKSSRYTISLDDDDNEPRFSNDNPYLNDNVD